MSLDDSRKEEALERVRQGTERDAQRLFNAYEPNVSWEILSAETRAKWIAVAREARVVRAVYSSSSEPSSSSGFRAP